MATKQFTLASLGIIPNTPNVWLKTQTGKGVVSKEAFLSAVKKTGYFSVQAQIRKADGTYSYLLDDEGNQIYARGIDAKVVDPMKVRNDLYAYALQQNDPSAVNIELICDTKQ